VKQQPGPALQLLQYEFLAGYEENLGVMVVVEASEVLKTSIFPGTSQLVQGKEDIVHFLGNSLVMAG